MTDKLIEALEWALAEIRSATRYENEDQFWNSYDLARAALASAKAEPVAWMYDYGHSRIVKENRDPGMTGYTETPLYAVPPRTAEDERADLIEWLDRQARWHDQHDDGLSGFDKIAAGYREALEGVRAGDHVGAAHDPS